MLNNEQLRSIGFNPCQPTTACDICCQTSTDMLAGATLPGQNNEVWTYCRACISDYVWSYTNLLPETRAHSQPIRTIDREDIHGVSQTIVLHGAGYYTIGNGDSPQSLMTSFDEDGAQIVNLFKDNEIFSFSNRPDETANLGYENFWMLIRYFPHVRTPGLSGVPCRGRARTKKGVAT